MPVTADMDSAEWEQASPIPPENALNSSAAEHMVDCEEVAALPAQSDSAHGPTATAVQEEYASQGGGSDGHRHRNKPADLSTLVDKVWEREKERVERWRNEINSLLTFAGLFAAVITGFGVQYYALLQPAVPDYNTRILDRISVQLAQLANQTDDSSFQQALTAGPEESSVPTYIAILWFAALVCGLSAASIAISVNQWLNNLLTPAGLSGSGPHEQLRIWNLRHETFRRWRLAVFIDIPSVLLQIALILFLVGLVGYLWQLSVKVALPSLVLVTLLMLFLFGTTVAPVILAYTPFISPQSIFLRWLSSTLKLIYYAPMFQLHRWLWLNNKFDKMEMWLGQKKRRFEERLRRLQASRSRGYYSWTAEEAAYLQSEAGEAFDRTALANVFFLVKDVSQLVPRIESYLSEMPSDVAASNILTICKQSNIASIVEPTEDEEWDVNTQWQRDSLDKKIFVTMGTIITGRYTKMDNPKIPNEAIDAMDQLLTAIIDAEGGIKVYMQLFTLLRHEGSMEAETTKRILHLIWRYDDDFIVSDEDDFKQVRSSLSQMYKRTDDDLQVVLTFTALTLKIFTRTQAVASVPGNSEHSNVQAALTDWRDYMKKYLKSDRKTYPQNLMSGIPWWGDRYLKEYLASMISTDQEVPVSTLTLVYEVLSQLRLLFGEDDFQADRILWSKHTFKDIMDKVKELLGMQKNQPTPPLEQEALDYETRRTQAMTQTKVDTVATGTHCEPPATWIDSIRTRLGCRSREATDPEDSVVLTQVAVQSGPIDQIH